MTHSEIVKALVGMLMGMLTAFLSSTIVSIALPTIITELKGTQNQYTWIVTATLLASTATTPIWGKLADLFSKKILLQISIVIFTAGSIAAGFSQSTEILIVWRVVQGLGLGGLQALVTIAIAAMVSPRERGRYMGPVAAVMSLATVAGPLLGGLIVDTEWLGWQWCFFVGVPLSVAALIVIQKTLHLPEIKRKVTIDYTGAGLIAGGVSALLIWVTLGGNQFEWNSMLSFGLGGLGVLMLVLAVFVEARATDPIIPLRLFQDRTTVLATLASVAVGTAMFGGAVFLGQYFQIARHYSPTEAGLLTLPMVVGSMISASGSGALITRFGRWKGFLIAGSALMTAGFGLLGTIDSTTNMTLIGVYLFLLGSGMGMLMQNLVLAVQNSVSGADLGAASSTVAFFRSLGGTIGVSVLGAVLADRVAGLIANGLSALGIELDENAAEAGISNLNELPEPFLSIVRGAYGDGTATVFLIAAALSALSFLIVMFIREVPLRERNGVEQQRAEEADVKGIKEKEVVTQSH